MDTGTAADLDLKWLREQLAAWLQHVTAIPNAFDGVPLADALHGQVELTADLARRDGVSHDRLAPLVKLLQPQTNLAAIIPAAIELVDCLRLQAPTPASKKARRGSPGRPKAPKVQHVESLISQGLGNDAICERTGESTANVRQIRSRLLRES